MHNSRFSHIFLLLLVAYSFPLHSMEPAALREDVPGALPDDHLGRSFVEKYRQNPLNPNFAQHVISTAPEGVIPLINRLNRGDNRMNHSLFNGPLGIGKSILARAVAAQTGRSCFLLNLSSISREHPNSEIVALRNFFEGVFRLEEPAVIVLDEITDESNRLDRLIGEKG